MTDERHTPRRLGKCLFCETDLDALAAEGKLGHLCSAKPDDHADGSAYQSETDVDSPDVVFVTETRRDGSTYQRQLVGIERMERASNLAEKIAGLRQIIERDTDWNLDCSWSDAAMRDLATESLKAIEELSTALAEALGLIEHRVTWSGMPADALKDKIDLARIAELRAKFLGGTKR